MVQEAPGAPSDEQSFWLSDAQMARLEPFFPKSHGKPRVDDRRVLSGIIFVNRHGLRWCDAPREYGPPKTLYNRWKRWSGMGVFSVLGRREDQAERRREHIASLQQQATESEQRLKRLYDAIEAGVADLDDPALKKRIAGLKVIRDQARADADRAQALLESPGHSAISSTMIQGFARRARERIRGTEGGYRRDHLRSLAQRVEVADDAIRIMGSKTELLRTLIAGQVRRLACPEAV